MIRINRYKRENDKQKGLLIMIFFHFHSWKRVLHMLLKYKNDVISLNSHEQPEEIHGWMKLKAQRANSHTISLNHVWFSTDILLSSLVSSALLLLAFWGFLKLKMYILIHTGLCKRVSDKKKFSRWFSETRLLFFSLTQKVYHTTPRVPLFYVEIIDWRSR